MKATEYPVYDLDGGYFHYEPTAEDEAAYEQELIENLALSFDEWVEMMTADLSAEGAALESEVLA